MDGVQSHRCPQTVIKKDAWRKGNENDNYKEIKSVYWQYRKTR